MRVKRWIAYGIIALTVLGCGIVYLLAAPHRDSLPAHQVSLLTCSTAMAIMFIGCAILFLLGLKKFTAKLKVAYSVFCGGVILFAFGELILPIFALFGEAGLKLLTIGVPLVPIVLGVGGMYAGTKLFANLFGVTSIWSKPWFTVLATIGASVGAYFLPLGPAISDVPAAHGTNSLIMMMVILFVASATLIYHIRGHAGQTYQRALLWFFFAMAGLAVSALITMEGVMIFGNMHPFIAGGQSLFVQAIFGLILLRAAYEFNAMSVNTDEADTPAQAPAAAASATAPTASVRTIDVIIAAAQKASNTTAVDPLLDDLRMITAHIGPNQAPTPDDEARLVATYRELENYLAEKEPVRRYPKEELRQLLRNELHITGPAFFDALP
jgi:hypothetical protein